ncbi:hypothetical protein RHGRI_027368 [Rhododendron griersonianum]|uniref:DUF1997 domain-containing protein n=1 Tax=Rhododendron griersonianum TaxID=479676 RepID=A0AAV6IWA8_9ERIC|nr:hypothetical protein RHGRI_027368 [Rhododendron griersonianum]
MLTFSFDLWQLEGSPIVVAQNEKFDGKGFSEYHLFAAKLCNHFGILCRRSKVLHWESGMVNTSMLVETSDKSALTLIWYGHAASMVNRVSCNIKESNLSVAELTSDTVIEVSIDIPFAFLPIPVQAIESTGTQILEQILRITLPRFMAQLVKDYQAWASGDTSRQPLGTGDI